MAAATLGGYPEGLSEDNFSWYLPYYLFQAQITDETGKHRERYTQKEIQLYVGDKQVVIKPEYALDDSTLPINHTARIITHNGFIGGKPVIGQPTEILLGKNIGRSNCTTPFSQAMKEALASSNQIMRKRIQPVANNTTSREVVITNDGDDIKPLIPAMLLSKNLEDVNILPFPVYVQPKLDGIRCTITQWNDTLRSKLVLYNDSTVVETAVANGIVAYSRNFKIFEVWHLTPMLKHIFKDRPTLYLDGELMVYTKTGKTCSLQTINSIVRKASTAQQSTFVIFDICEHDNLLEPFSERLKAITELVHAYSEPPLKNEINKKFITFVTTTIVKNFKEAVLAHKTNLRKLYEGSVFRASDSPYIPSYNNRRSSSSFKWKPVHRMELPVIGWDHGNGKAAKLVRWILEVTLRNGEKSTITLDPNWTEAERVKYFTWLTPARFVKHCKNKLMTIEYQDLSDDGVPLRAKAIAFRTAE